jgi:hypothetical protein
MEDILSTYDKLTPSALIQKLNVSGHTLLMTYFHILECGTHSQNLSATFRYTLYIRPAVAISTVYFIHPEYQ